MLLRLPEATYALDSDEETWIRQLHAHARPLLDEGLGLFAYSYGLEGDEVALSAVAAGEDARGVEIWSALNAWGARNQPQVVALYRTRLVQSLSFANVAAVSRQSLYDLHATFEPFQVRDMLALVAHHRAGNGVVLTVPLTHERQPSRGLERTFANVGSMLAALVHLRRQRQSSRRDVTLTNRERSVALLLLQGLSDKEIAHRLDLAMSTVSTLAQRIRRKLECRAGEESLGLCAPDGERALARRRSLFHELTVAERDVALDLLCGVAYSAIAHRRESSERTVAAQATSIFRKTGLSGRRALAAAFLGGEK